VSEKPVGTIGDVNPLDYGGGLVFSDRVEWYEPDDENDENSRVRCYRVDFDVLSDSWIDFNAVASTVDRKAAELLHSARTSTDPQVRANAVWDVALHYGWHELDGYSLHLTRAEAEARIGEAAEA
jgi:hypothetical protein